MTCHSSSEQSQLSSAARARTDLVESPAAVCITVSRTLKRAVLIDRIFPPHESEFRPTLLFEVLGKPLVQRWVEFLVDNGVGDIDFILCEKPHLVRTFLGDGGRWGATFRFHLTRDPYRPYARLPFLADQDDEVIVAVADHLPSQSAAHLPRLLAGPLPSALCWRGARGRAVHWGHLGVVDGGWLQRARWMASDFEFNEQILESANASGCLVEIPAPVQVRAIGELISANILALHEAQGDAGQASTRPAGVARDVSLHKSVVLNPPVSIGQGCRIGARARIGPDVSIGQNCIIAEGTSIVNSVILSRTYIGPNLHLSDVVADGNHIASRRLDATSTDPYRLLAGSLPESPSSLLSLGITPYAIAVALAIFTAPAFAILALTGRLFTTRTNRRRHRVSVLCTRPYLRHLHEELIPALPSILTGRRSLVGITEWSEADRLTAPSAWRSLWRNSPAGMVTESFVRFGPGALPEERAAADTSYVIRQSHATDTKLMGEYSLRVAKDILSWAVSRTR